MKQDQILAELFALLRLMVERSADQSLAARVAALEQYRAETEKVWQRIEEQ